MNRFGDEQERFIARPQPMFESLSNPPFVTEFVGTHITSHNTMIDSEHEATPTRTLHDYLCPTRTSTPSCIIFPPNMPHMDLKSRMIQLLLTFYDLEDENPYVHIRELEEVVVTFHNQRGTMNVMRLKFFPFSEKKQKASCIHCDHFRLELGLKWLKHSLANIFPIIKKML